MKFSKRQFILIKNATFFAFLASATLSAQAEFDDTQGGYTEIIQCPVSSWDVCPVYHDDVYWGGSGPNLTYLSPAKWWDYAEPDTDSFACGNWINGSIAGGATYDEGQPSVPQGVDVSIDADFWDFVNFDLSTQCGHQHVSTYVWGWRYNGNSWMREFVTANLRSSYPDANGICQFQGDNNPVYASLPGNAFGPDVLNIKNSPYPVLHTKSQATSHAGADCGQFECFHRVRVQVTYDGGPGVNKAVVAHVPATNDLVFDRGDTDPIIKVTNPETLTLKLDRQNTADQRLRPHAVNN